MGSIAKNKSSLSGVNLKNYTSDITIAVDQNALITGPVTVPNLTVNGSLNIINNINVTGNITVGTAGSIYII